MKTNKQQTNKQTKKLLIWWNLFAPIRMSDIFSVLTYLSTLNVMELLFTVLGYCF